jgi:hypothetical protein
LQSVSCPLSSAYCADDVRGLDHPSTLGGGKQVPINGGVCSSYNTTEYFDGRSMAKYGTNPAYSSMINSASAAPYPSRNKSISTAYCSDRTGLPVPSDTTAVIAVSPLRQPPGGVRLQHGGRVQQPMMTTFPWHGGPEVTEPTRNYFYVHDVHRLPENAVDETTIAASTDVGVSPFAALLTQGGDRSVIDLADGYNESMRSNASSNLDDHIYEIAG